MGAIACIVRGSWRAIGPLALCMAAGCHSVGGAARQGRPTVLRVGVAGATPQAARQLAGNQTLEGLFNFDHDGRLLPWLASSVSQSDDRLTVRITLAETAFHDGSPVVSATVRDILRRGLPNALGPAYADIRDISSPSAREIEFALNRPSAFLLEGLDIPVEKPGQVGVGTGPYRLASAPDARVELEANPSYRLGPPAIERIVFQPYGSVRAAWADLLRGEVDALYEVGLDALDSLRPSQRVRVFSYRRHYAQLVMFNLSRPVFRDPQVRRAMNDAIDRRRLVEDILNGNGAPAEGPVWPTHWARQLDAPGFTYRPTPLPSGREAVRFSCLLPDPAQERLALAIQRQLQAIGVDMQLEIRPPQETLKRLQSGDFDAILSDFVQGPNLVRPYLFWHSAGPFNYGHYRSERVDQALDSVRHAASDEVYREGVTAFQRAIMDDPPAIFLVWGDRARAVSARFEVPAATTERDVWSALRLWRPSADN